MPDGHDAGYLAAVDSDTVSPVEDGGSIPSLLHAALEGDDRAWNRIVDEYTNLLWWIARSHRLDDATAADVVQTVWLQLVQHGRAITEPDRLPAWLATVARREAQRRMTSARRQVPTDTFEDRSADHSPTAEERVLDEEATAAALAAFHRLGDRCQELLALLCAVPPKSYDEISTLLSVPIGSLGPMRQRCLATLRVEMRGMGF